ncbi:hypothetical protein [Bacillus sp. JJ722]|uniref:hypothetical protein n=1 Tax=Bacillus sp. JJ722 TaxID=3122973 RepID=UPI002FFE79EF
MILRLYRAKLNTGGKTVEELKAKWDDSEMTTDEIETWIKAYNLIDGLEVIVVEGIGDDSYSLIGWNEEDAEKIRDYTYLAEQDPVFGSYIDDHEEFIKDWDSDDYSPSGSLCFDEDDLEIIERLKGKSEQTEGE